MQLDHIAASVAGGASRPGEAAAEMLKAGGATIGDAVVQADLSDDQAVAAATGEPAHGAARRLGGAIPRTPR